MSLDARALLRQLFDAAVAAAQPHQVLAAHLPPPPRGRTLVLGAGKAAAAMAAALDAAWPAQAPLSGLVVTRYGHVPPVGFWGQDLPKPRIEVMEAAHPVPDAASERAAQRMLALARGEHGGVQGAGCGSWSGQLNAASSLHSNGRLSADDLVICLISGGGSALMSLPAPGLTLADKQAVNRALLASGASIGEMNTVRKHLSAIKGGRLAAACAPAPVLSLLISDVPGDEPGLIASGPSLPDASGCAEALAICRRYRIALPAAALSGLQSGAFETPKPGDPVFADHAWRLVATPQQSLEAAARRAAELGLGAHILSDAIEGESREVGRVHAALALAVARRSQPFARPCVLLSGGETTVTLHAGAPVGRGGRAGEFLLGCALGLDGEPGVHALAADTDGIDGVERNAGAFISPSTLARAAALGLSAREALARHDGFPFFEMLGDLLVSGPTYTNVNDFRALLIQ